MCKLYKWHAVWYRHVFVNCAWAFHSWNPQVHPLLVRKGGICNHFPPQLYILLCIQVPCCPLLWRLKSNFGDFSNVVCSIIKITIAESNPDTELLTHQMFCFSPSILARDSKMPVMTASVASDQGLISPLTLVNVFSPTVNASAFLFVFLLFLWMLSNHVYFVLQQMAVMVYKRSVFETRRKPKGLLRPKTRANLKDAMNVRMLWWFLVQWWSSSALFSLSHKNTWRSFL